MSERPTHECLAVTEVRFPGFPTVRFKCTRDHRHRNRFGGHCHKVRAEDKEEIRITWRGESGGNGVSPFTEERLRAMYGPQETKDELRNRRRREKRRYRRRLAYGGVNWAESAEDFDDYGNYTG